MKKVLGLVKEKSSLSLMMFSLLMMVAPQLAMAQSFQTTTGKSAIFASGPVKDAITFAFWLLAIIELVDFFSNISTSGFFMKIFRPAMLILLATKWSTIVGWFV